MSLPIPTPLAPVAIKKNHILKFGFVKGENRGKNPMDPPLEKIDPYYWMRDDTRTNKEIIMHLKLENEYTENCMKPLENLRGELYEELLSHIQETDTTDAVPYGKYEYYSHTKKGLAYPIHCRKKRENPNSLEEVILDENELSNKLGTAQMNVGDIGISPSQKLLAFSVDTSGYETYEISIIDLSNNKLISKISNVADFEWGFDDNTIFYTKMDSAHRPYQVWKHCLNNSRDDELIFEEEDELFWVGISKTEERDLLLIGSSSKETSEIRYINLHKNSMELKLIKERKQGVLYSISKRGNQLFIVTNADGAKNFEIVIADISKPDIWAPFNNHLKNRIFGHNELRSISFTISFQDFLVVFGRENGLKQVWCVNFEKNIPLDFHQIEFSESAYVVGLGSNLEFNSDCVRISFSSMITPPTIFDYIVSERQLKLVKQKNIPNYDSSKYSTKRINAPSEDGTLIPISVVYNTEFHSSEIITLILRSYSLYSLLKHLLYFSVMSLLQRS